MEPAALEVRWGLRDRIVTAVVLGFLLVLASFWFYVFVGLNDRDRLAWWQLSLTSIQQLWHHPALRGTPIGVDLLLRAPAILLPAAVAAWPQSWTMAQRCGRGFALYLLCCLAYAGVLSLCGAQLGGYLI